MTVHQPDLRDPNCSYCMSQDYPCKICMRVINARRVAKEKQEAEALKIQKQKEYILHTQKCALSVFDELIEESIEELECSTVTEYYRAKKDKFLLLIGDFEI